MSDIDRWRQVTDNKPRKTEDDIQREQFGPRGVPGAPDPAKMTPQREKKTPKKPESLIFSLSRTACSGLIKIPASVTPWNSSPALVGNHSVSNAQLSSGCNRHIGLLSSASR